jgi:prephenate dehydrogenase
LFFFKVSVDSLNLSDVEKKLFIRMAGPRFNVGNRIVKFTCERFSDRMENRKYLVYQLEQLIREAKELSKMEKMYE